MPSLLSSQGLKSILGWVGAVSIFKISCANHPKTQQERTLRFKEVLGIGISGMLYKSTSAFQETHHLCYKIGLLWTNQTPAEFLPKHLMSWNELCQRSSHGPHRWVRTDSIQRRPWSNRKPFFRSPGTARCWENPQRLSGALDPPWHSVLQLVTTKSWWQWEARIRIVIPMISRFLMKKKAAAITLTWPLGYDVFLRRISTSAKCLWLQYAPILGKVLTWWSSHEQPSSFKLCMEA